MRRRVRENGAWIRVAFIKKYAGTALGAALLLALAVFGITYRNEIWAVLTQQDARDAFIAFVHESGFLGLLAFLGLQVLQVVVAVLPGEPVELMAGLLYGTWGGLALCLLGVGLSSAAVYYCVRAAGARAIDASVLAKYHFLRDEAHVKFFLFHYIHCFYQLVSASQFIDIQINECVTVIIFLQNFFHNRYFVYNTDTIIRKILI